MKTKRQWLATRVLKDSANPDLELEIQLGMPEQRKDGSWRCTFRVAGLNQGKTAYAGGIDPLQALVNAIDCIATQLRESGRSLTWMEGEPGIRRQIPIFLGPEFADRIESFIAAEIDSFIQNKKGRQEVPEGISGHRRDGKRRS